MTSKSEQPKTTFRMLYRCAGEDWILFAGKGGLEPFILDTPVKQWANRRVELAVVDIPDGATSCDQIEVSISAWNFDADGVVRDPRSTAKRLLALLPPSSPAVEQERTISEEELRRIKDLVLSSGSVGCCDPS